MPTALIVDDSRLTRTIIKNALSAAGYVVSGEAVNGREGIEMAQRLKPDLVTIDLTMPEKGGMESLDEVRAAHPGAKIIVVTALGGQKLLQDDAKKAGALAMIAKPFNPMDLARLADKLLGRQGTPQDPLGIVAPNEARAKSPVAGLTSLQISDLMELGNIGAGNAASRLSDLIGERCLISPPQVAYLSPEAVLNAFAAEQFFLAALSVKVLGEIPAILAVALRKESAPVILRYMTHGASKEGKDLSDAAKFALRQAGEFLSRAFSQAVNQFLADRSKPALPDIAVANEGELSDLLKTGNGPVRLAIHCGFSDVGHSFEGKLAYILDLDAQKAVLDHLNRLLFSR